MTTADLQHHSAAAAESSAAGAGASVPQQQQQQQHAVVWRELQCRGDGPPSALQYHSTCAYKGQLWLFAGQPTAGRCSDSLFVFTPNEPASGGSGGGSGGGGARLRGGVWRRILRSGGKAWPPARRAHVAAVAHICLWVHSGASEKSGASILGDKWKYEFASGEWTEVHPAHSKSPRPSGRACHCMMADGDALYLTLGCPWMSDEAEDTTQDRMRAERWHADVCGLHAFPLPQKSAADEGASSALRAHEWALLDTAVGLELCAPHATRPRGRQGGTARRRACAAARWGGQHHVPAPAPIRPRPGHRHPSPSSPLLSPSLPYPPTHPHIVPSGPLQICVILFDVTVVSYARVCLKTTRLNCIQAHFNDDDDGR